ncbi:uncharacterized protein LOC123865447 [Maniola jurtina]|uniref:uncharacterized protein LOC123865447 n=1 Tax=Maniola jurtina TaxID=191418 RepID=UPI001E68A6B5|nr:uncharacterized protein LOC123865447 [Maniola jurtina]
MESKEVYIKNLEGFTYRNLQQIAKTLSLPSNFKKVYLIELIIAKKYKSEAEVQNIIDRVRQERLNQSKGKKRSRGKPKKTKAQGQAQKTLAARNEVSYSPPISETPKRLSSYRHDSPDILAITPINPKRNLLDTVNPHNRNSNVAATDRVLRSYSLQSERPNYELTSDIQELKTQCCSSTNTKLKVIEQTTKCYVRKRKADDLLKPNFLISNGGETAQAIVPANRQIMYPGQSEEIVPRILSTKNVSIRRSDGSYTQINAVIQKRNAISPKKNNYNTKSPEITSQDKTDVNISEDLINSDNNNCFNIIKYPDATGISPIKCTGTKMIGNNNHKENSSASDIQLVDYEKTREKQSKDQRNVPLPKICDVFPQFSYMRDPTQPIYVQVGSEAIYNVPSYPTNVDRSTIDTPLEPLFNMQTKTPPRQSNVDNTSLVFTVQTVPTATTLPDPAGPAGGALNVTSPLVDDNNNDNPDLNMFIQEFSQLCDPKMTDWSSSSSDMPNATYTLSEKFEHALEIICNDSDYMESIGMSEPVECVFCGWAGPILMLDCHIRKDHACSIYKMDKSEWNITYTLKSIIQCGVWLHRVIEYDQTLYLLSVKYERPGFFVATFALLSLDLLVPNENIVTMTLFNKRTGEPFSWTGDVPNFPPGSPSDDGANGLKIKLNLLDLKPKKTPVSYDDIHVTVFVEISNKKNTKSSLN